MDVTCSERGGECVSEPTAVDGVGARFVYACPEHGLQSVVDPFADLR